MFTKFVLSIVRNSDPVLQEMGERLLLWEVHGRYVPRELATGGRMVEASPYKLADLEPEEHNAVQVRLAKQKKAGLDYRMKMGRRYGTTHYAPLENRPGLFLEFSLLADGGEVNPEQRIAWVRKHGVLGRVPAGQAGRPARVVGVSLSDVYSVFVEEARLASWTRRLFEAVTRKRKPDVVAIEPLIPDWYVAAAPQAYEEIRNDPKQMQSAALHVVRDTVMIKVEQGCFRELLERDNFRQKRKGPFVERWGFNSPLGAMWLRFEWLATYSRARACDYCGTLLPETKQIDADFCDKRCKQANKRDREREGVG